MLILVDLACLILLFQVVQSEPTCDPKLPDSLGEFCREKCDGALVCVNNKCTCPVDYTLSISGNKQICHRECTDDEIAIRQEEISFCAKRCNKDEVRVDLQCLPAALLGDSCVNDGQCVSLFTQCINGRCSCLPDFQLSADNYCIPNKFNCRFGSPLLDKKGDIIPCEITASNSTQQPVDSCPAAAFCQVYMPYSRSIGQQGHCCPVINQECPVGSAIRVSHCSSCPQKTHYCYGNICCPQPCPPDFFFHYDRCYPFVELRQQCYLDQQCERHIGKCIQGECRCPWRAIEIDGRCEPRCSANELRVGDVCVRRYDIGEACDTDNLCPEGAGCVEGKCRCHCHLTHVGGNLCAIPPRCPDPKNARGLPGKILSSPHFCRLPHAVDAGYYKVANISDRCPTGQFCSRYLGAHRIGVCCQLPDPICPDGSMVDSDCDPLDVVGCGDMRFCFRHLSPVDQAHVAHVCCPKPVNHILPGVPDAIVSNDAS